MKIEIEHEKGDKWGEGEYYEITVDGERFVSAGNCEPEDANLGRDLNFVFQIVPMMTKAWEAGKNDEEFEITNVTALIGNNQGTFKLPRVGSIDAEVG